MPSGLKIKPGMKLLGLKDRSKVALKIRGEVFNEVIRGEVFSYR